MAKRSHARRVNQPRRAPEQAKEVDFSTEYGYVLSDLKRFWALALIMFGVLIALALVLPAL